MDNIEIINKDADEFVAHPNPKDPIYWDSKRAEKLMDKARADERAKIAKEIHEFFVKNIPLAYAQYGEELIKEIKRE